MDRLVAALTGLTVDVGALRAGVGRGGALVDTDTADDQSVIGPHVTSTVRLAEPILLARGEGRLLITSSVAATMPGSFQSVHNASAQWTRDGPRRSRGRRTTPS
ncbi:SDR family oxidoreductase [Streptomyces mutabilis]|uniref:hypothetical protein n=1 Tax=Streptomyces mutabilis TaxID=67332 RepID=UPI0038B44E61